MIFWMGASSVQITAINCKLGTLVKSNMLQHVKLYRLFVRKRIQFAKQTFHDEFWTMFTQPTSHSFSRIRANASLTTSLQHHVQKHVCRWRKWTNEVHDVTLLQHILASQNGDSNLTSLSIREYNRLIVCTYFIAPPIQWTEAPLAKWNMNKRR